MNSDIGMASSRIDSVRRSFLSSGTEVESSAGQTLNEAKTKEKVIKTGVFTEVQVQIKPDP